MLLRTFTPVLWVIIVFMLPSNADAGENKYGESSAAYAIGREGHFPDTLMNAIEPFLKPSDLILDVASGTGLGTRFLCEHGYKNIMGADFDPKMIEQAELANTKECPIKYVRADVTERLPFPSNHFDAITTFSAFHWYADPKAMKEIARVLKPDGVYIIVTTHQTQDPIKTEVQKIVKNASGKTTVETNNKKDSRTLDTSAFLEKNGFKVINQKPFSYELYYDPEKYLNYVVYGSSGWNAMRNTPQGEEVIKKVKLYLDTVKDSNGQIKEKRDIFVIAAKKK